MHANPDGLWTYRARLHRVIDGDTVIMHVDHGMRIMSAQSIRLTGINAPETGQPGGAEAIWAVANWFANHDESHDTGPDKWGFNLTTERDRRSFNRYLGHIRCAACNETLNDTLANP